MRLHDPSLRRGRSALTPQLIRPYVAAILPYVAAIRPYAVVSFGHLLAAPPSGAVADSIAKKKRKMSSPCGVPTVAWRAFFFAQRIPDIARRVHAGVGVDDVGFPPKPEGGIALLTL